MFSLGVVLVGCEAGRLPTEPTSAAQTTLQPGGQSANSGAAEGINVTGSWTWQETVESAIPPFIVEMIGQGIVPEGEITYLTCKGGGEMKLVQTGGTFEGTATQGGSCVTEGGQGPFWPPSFPPVLEVTNGVISGKDISWTFNNCAYTAKVVGSGNKLVGQGACDIPLPPPVPSQNAKLEGAAIGCITRCTRSFLAIRFSSSSLRRLLRHASVSASRATSRPTLFLNRKQSATVRARL